MTKEEIIKELNTYNKDTLMETLEIEFVALGEHFITAKMPVTKKVYQPFKILHGGATAALAETVGSLASAYFLNDKEKIIKGIDLNISHVKSKREGWVFATAKPLHLGRTTHIWEVRVVDEAENLISICKLTNIVLEKK